VASGCRLLYFHEMGKSPNDKWMQPRDIESASMTDEPKKTGEDDDCTVPPPLAKSELHAFVLDVNEHQVREISDYVEWQCNKKRENELEEKGTTEIQEEIVDHAEKIKSERVHGIDYDAWDVHTNQGRWWVITSPTNLYSQTLMPSLDYTLSFHIGVASRMAAKPEIRTNDELLVITSRKIFQAHERFDAADEVEDFQAVGMLCREALTTFIHEIAEAGMLEKIEVPPKLSDFKGWAEHVIGLMAAGASAEFVRGYLKAMANKSWELVNWLTHAKNATRHDAQLALSATEIAVDQLMMLALRTLANAPEQCGKCGSFKITVTWRPDVGEEGEYVAECDVCSAERVRGEEA